MKRILSLLLCFVCFIIVIFMERSACAAAEAKPSTEIDIYNNIDKYLQECVKNAHIPAMSITIVNTKEVLFSGTYGQCESSDTPFLLGSVSKSFTAVCVMQLVEQKKINLNAKISAYLPRATDGDRITVSQLLNHTSGLGEHQTLEDYRIINEQGVHHYANVNYTLLGKIIETVSGKSYDEYISENLFLPLELSHTSANLSDSKENGLIDGYINYWGIPIKTEHKYPSSETAWISVPAGYISSSSNDLGKYLQMYLNGGEGIISEESINTMFYGDTVYIEDAIPYWYGYGWNTIKDPLTESVLRHAGLVETGTSCVYIMPESDIAIAIVTNVNDYFVTNEMMDSLGWGVVLMLLGEPENEIASNAYVLRHLQIDLIMILILLLAILPLCFLPRYMRRIDRKKISSRIIWLLLFHLLLPVFILLLVPMFFATPLWVAKAFVPDVFITVIISSILLFICGLVKSIILYKRIKYI